MPLGGQVVAAAKTVSGDGKIEQNEIDSLQSIGEYYGETYVSNGARSEYHVVFMAYHHGIPLYKTAGWQEFVSPPTEPKYRIRKAPGSYQLAWKDTRFDPWHPLGKDRQKCEEFFALATELVALRAKEYASKGVYHKDLNLRNVLFQPDYPKNQLIAFVDWGLSERTSDPDLVYTEVKKQAAGGHLDLNCVIIRI
ncbi:hypothetical protein FRB99_007617 [Tulasnella sp. 403]|nr:hypothetical protein FRB99_007617 [Tulasnella sp. 403]